GTKTPDNNKLIAAIRQKRSRWVLASGREKVLDGSTNSPFAKYLIEYLGKNAHKPILISELSHFIKYKVQAVTNQKQIPEGYPLSEANHEGGEFVFYPKTNFKDEWNKIKDSKDASLFSKYARIFPDSEYTKDALALANKLKEEKYQWLLLNKNHLLSVKLFIEDFSDGYYVEEAKERYDSLDLIYKNLSKDEREEESMEALRKNPSIENFRKHQKEFAGGKHDAEIRDKIQVYEEKALEKEYWNQQYGHFKNAQLPRLKRAPLWDYIHKYPHGDYIPIAHKLIEDVTLFEEAEKKRTLHLYENYDKKTHYQGVYKRTVDKRIQELKKEKAAFEKAKNTYTRKALQSFKSAHPDSIHNEKVDSMIEEINQADTALYEKVSSVNTIKAYTKYINKYEDDNGLFIDEATKHRSVLIQKDNVAFHNAKLENTRLAYRNYLTIHPEGISKEKAVQAIAEIEEMDESTFWAAIETGKIAPLKDYLNQFPDGNYRLDAERQIKLLAEKLNADTNTIPVIGSLPKERTTSNTTDAGNMQQLLARPSVSDSNPTKVNISTSLNHSLATSEIKDNQPDDSLLKADLSNQSIKQLEGKTDKDTVGQNDSKLVEFTPSTNLIKYEKESISNVIDNSATKPQTSRLVSPPNPKREIIEITKLENDALKKLLVSEDIVSHDNFLLTFPNSTHQTVVGERKRKLIHRNKQRKKQRKLWLIIATMLAFVLIPSLVILLNRVIANPKKSLANNSDVERMINEVDNLATSMKESILDNDLEKAIPSDTFETIASKSGISPYIANSGTFHLVIESFKESQNAERLLQKLQTKGYLDAKIIIVQSWYVLSLEQFFTEEEAVSRQKELDYYFDQVIVDSYNNFIYY
ncbi:MAG: SPOR domain-containing protein, partial [Bacteroidota bacterium]